jgi:DNA-binding GntR family transcriptional regulator
MVSKARSSFQTPLNQTTAERVRNYMRERIIAGEFKGGDRLVQDDLAARLGISRIPLREGFARLEAEGFITVEAHQGAVVKPLSLDDGNELFELRGLLECRLLTAAIPRMSEATFAAAEQALADLERAESIKKEALDEWSAMNWRFHQTLYQPANEPRTMRIVETLHLHAERYLRLQMSIQGRTDRARDQHRELIELCRRGDTRGAERTLQEHILNILPDLRSLGLPESREAAVGAPEATRD